MTGQVKRAFKYRFHPTNEQAAELSRTFGCVRLVYNKALEERTRAWYGEQRRVSYVQSSATLTEWKKTGELAFLTEVSSVPLQQALRHSDGVRPLLRQACQVPALQDAEEVPRVRRVHPLRLQVP